MVLQWKCSLPIIQNAVNREICKNERKARLETLSLPITRAYIIARQESLRQGIESISLLLKSN